jgi:ATP-dependent helicase/DNAse subunit B
LTPTQRGQLVHEVMHAVWRGRSNGIHTLDDLLSVQDLNAFVRGHVQRAMRDEKFSGLRQRLPRRYLEIEESRLVRLVCAWLEYERSRQPFEVIDTELKSTAAVGGLTLDLRLDRIDQLNDRSLLVIDYKTGNVSPKDWDLPRPDDVQLPLYAIFALDQIEQPLGGLVFAKLRPGESGMEFDGRLRDAQATLIGNLGRKQIAKNPLTDIQLADWRGSIAQLAADFVAGRAEADPRDYPKTCDRCGLHTLCRIRESRESEEAEGEDGSDNEGAEDE